MTSDPVLLHVGLPRAASRFLRQYLWSGHSGCRLAFQDDASQTVLRSLTQDDSLEYDAAAAARVLAFGAPENRLQVVSYPTLSAQAGADIKLKIARARALFPDAQVLMVLRHQVERLRSHYSMSYQRAVKQGAASFPGFETWAYKAPNAATTNSMLQWRRPMDRLADWPILSVYRETFGPERVHVVAMETVQQDPARFADLLARVCGLEAAETLHCIERPPLYRSTDGQSVFLKRTGADGLRQVAQRLGLMGERKKKAADMSVSETMRADIEAACGGSNRHIAEVYALPLAEYGYPGVVRNAAVARGACEGTGS